MAFKTISDRFIMKLDYLDHVAIQVDNINLSIDWYLDKFKCKKIYSDESWGLIKFSNCMLALVKKEQHPPHFAILNNNLSQSKHTKIHRDGSISKYIIDTDGNNIEIIKYKK